MSETAATDAAVTTATEAPPEAPESAEEAPQPEPTPEQPERRGDRLTAKKGAVQRAREAYEQRAQAASEASKAKAKGEEAASEDAAATDEGDGAPPVTPDAKGNLHGPDGKFVPKDGTEAAASDDEAAAAPETDEAARADEVPEGHVKIELDEQHPWRRSAGDKPYFVVPADQEQLYRTAVNEATRRKDVERLEREKQEIHRQNIEMATRLRLAQEGQIRSLEDPALQKLLKEIETHFPEQFEYVKTALETAPEARIREEVEQGMAGLEFQNQARTFLTEMEAQAPQKYGVWAEAGQLKPMLAKEVAAYGDFVDQRIAQGGRGPSVEEFFSRLDVRYAQDPRVIAKVRDYRAQEAEKQRQAAKEEARKELEAEMAAKREKEKREVATRHERVRGPSKVRGVSTGQRAMEPTGEDEQIRQMSSSERRTALRQRAVERARARSG